MTAKTLRLILGDQLNDKHSWFEQVDNNVTYLIAEIKQESDYVTHHIQKICAFFVAMKNFSQHLSTQGHKVLHLNLDDTKKFKDLSSLITHYCEKLHCEKFEFQRPDEYRLLEQMHAIQSSLTIPSEEYDTEHFYLKFNEIESYVKPHQTNLMEAFYRKLRKKFDILMDGKKPLGNSWNYDKENRSSLKSADLDKIPAPLLFSQDVSETNARIQRHKIKFLGKPEKQLHWPTSPESAETLLHYFCTHCLPRFGQYQDAMTERTPHAWSLYHSRLSFALNTKILSPSTVIETAIRYYHDPDNDISLPQIEGFVRQILGWREFIRCMYWVNMPDYKKQNFFNAKRSLPGWYWTGDTKMNCLSKAITQSLEYAYAHHIQRLMITGNFALLSGIKPEEVDAWYLGIYIDAIEWVELPNTLGMALFADGGWLATKPYAASSNYINKMSDYCKTCFYDYKQKTGEKACPFNSLYWHFMHVNEDKLATNTRLAFSYKSWNAKTPDEKASLLDHAKSLLKRIDSL